MEVSVAHTLEDERKAFDSQLDALMKVHKGEFVLFREGASVAFFATNEEAYAEGIKRFGPDAVFLVTRVEPPRTSYVSLAWEAGVTFG
jgi:hypothetical protein